MPHVILAMLAAQPVLAGFAGVTLTGGLLFLLRQAPHRILAMFKEAFSVTLVVDQREESFKFLAAWLGQHDAVNRARRLMMAEQYDYEAGQWAWRLTLGQGWHLLRYAGAWFFVHREVKDDGGIAAALGQSQTQRLWLMSLGRGQSALRALIAAAKASYFGDGLVKVHFWDNGGGWVCADRRRPRPIETVFMPAQQKARLLADMRQFLSSRDVYSQRGVPWRRGYLFKGPPGTGKTTTIFAMAGYFNRSIYLLNLNNLAGDNGLIQAFNQVEPDGVIVIEDIDTVQISHKRTAEGPAATSGEITLSLSGASQPKGVTLSGLLNAIDGLAAREGRLLFITSNHPEKLDAALLRPGRIDLAESIEPLGREIALDMVAAFGAHPSVLDGLRFPVPAADLQGRLLHVMPAAPRLSVVA